MDVIIMPSAEEAAKLAAQFIAAAVTSDPEMVLGLATGSTQEPVYAELVRMHEEEGLDFSQLTTFNLDEYIGLEGDDPGSYRYFMDHHLFNKVNVVHERTFVPDGMAEDPYAEGVRYDVAIAEAGGVDLQLLGIGNDGHIGFNEPLSGFSTGTRPVVLSKITIEQNRPLFDDPGRIPHHAITMGVGTVLAARRNLMLATGSHKAPVVKAMIEGPLTSRYSASALQLHQDTIVIIDEDAAAELEFADEYRWMHENDLRWARV